MFLSESNLCGQTLLRLASRGSSIIAELLRLSQNVPPAAREEKSRYAGVMFDFGYVKTPEKFEDRINRDADLQSLDDEFQDGYEELLARFYTFFESISAHSPLW